MLSNGRSAKETLNHNQEMQRQRATIELLLQENQDKELTNAMLIIAKLPKNASFLDYLDVSEEEQNENKKVIKNAIRTLLNRYEFIALGIKYGAFEERIYKELQYSNVMNVWINAKPLIMELRRRKNKNTYFQEFEQLADKWGKEPLKSHKNT
ncbi:DUF4760 domain-containing protein [Avibacterium sp. 20-132]|uniref:DUF4760 domain-containing protein n=1 Tax=Avibacterium sp. 20-132 TaxID=2911526 RepID=UPI003FA369A2